MASILETIKSKRQIQSNASSQGLRSGIIIRATSPTYLVNDGVGSQVSCYSLLGERLKPGTRVWIAQGNGTNLILGISGRDVSFADEP